MTCLVPPIVDGSVHEEVRFFFIFSFDNLSISVSITNIKKSACLLHIARWYWTINKILDYCFNLMLSLLSNPSYQTIMRGSFHSLGE